MENITKTEFNNSQLSNNEINCIMAMDSKELYNRIISKTEMPVRVFRGIPVITF